MPVRAGAMLFGMLVHETIEDVHRAALRKEEATITTENITKWFDANYASISKTERTGQKVSKMHLYYTGEENGVPVITYPYTRTAVESTIAAFDETVHKILKNDYRRRLSDRKVCKNCDFRFCCQNQ